MLGTSFFLTYSSPLYSSITSSVQSLVATSKTNCTLVLHRAYKVWWLCLKQTACTLVLHRAYKVYWLCQKQPSDWSALYATTASDLPALCRFSPGAYNTRRLWPCYWLHRQITFLLSQHIAKPFATATKNYMELPEDLGTCKKTRKYKLCSPKQFIPILVPFSVS